MNCSVKFILANEKKYNEAAFPDRFSAYKDTIELAKLGESDKNGSEEEVQDTPQVPTKTRPPLRRPKEPS